MEETTPSRNLAQTKTQNALWTIARQGATILLATTSLAWLLRLLIDRDPIRGAWTLQVMLALAALLACVWGAINRRARWQTPMQRLQTLVPQIQRNEAAIEELAEIDGEMAPLVAVFQELLHDLRQQKAITAELHDEIRQRVASRTDALERTIGSLRQQATRDGLTGLFNRRFLDQYLPQAVRRVQSAGADLCLLMIDVDYFKVLNDTLGHAAGDELLKNIGQLIRSTIRGEDVAFRCGGDEFLVLMPNSDLAAGRQLSGRLTSLVDALGRTFRVPRPPRLSIGVATLGTTGQPSVETLLAEADKQLYAVKKQRHAQDGPSRPVKSTEAA